MYCNYERGVHDPTIIDHQGDFYLFSTDTNQPLTAGIPIRKSKDLVNWKFIGTVFNGVPTEAKQWSNAQGLWAPEVIKYNNIFRLYYSASTFGSTVSMIGLAESNSPEGPWRDKGEVIKTSPQLSQHNAIDANVVLDKNQEMWIVYGSFFGGIYIAPLNKETGKLKDNSFGTLIARRPKSVDTAIEGAFILYNECFDYYYLFASFDSLNDTYNIRVGRSKNIKGPYVDLLGNKMVQDETPEKVGVKLLGSYQFQNENAIFAPGHNSIFSYENTHYLVHHARLQPFSDQFILNIRKIYWLSNGWPVVSIKNITGLEERPITDSKKIVGNWNMIELNYGSEIVTSTNIEITHDELIQIRNNEYKYGSKIFKVFSLNGSHQEIILSGLNKNGLAFFGKKSCIERYSI